jgi:hypothetical protein
MPTATIVAAIHDRDIDEGMPNSAARVSLDLVTDQIDHTIDDSYLRNADP